MYPNEPCNDCPEEEEVGIPLPEKCGDQCAEIVEAACVNYAGAAVYCDTTPIAVPGSSVQSIIASMATQICSGVSGIAATISVGTVEINQIDFDQTASGSIVNSGTANNAVLDITLNIPEGVPADQVNMHADSTDSETLQTGSVVFTFVAPLVGPYIWENGTRLRVFYDANNYMEGIVTAHNATDVTINIDYVVGSGTYATWDIFVAGDVGSQGPAGTATATSPATVNSVAWNAPAACSITNSGTAQNAVLDFTFDIPAAVGVASAAINGLGELELTLDDATVLNAGSLLTQGLLPPGGVTNQVLAKNSVTDYDASWITIDTSAYLPIGGAAGDFLRKVDGTNFNTYWDADPYLAPVPSGSSTGYPVPFIHVDNETDFLNACASFNADAGSRYGAIIILAGDVTMTQDWAFLNMNNIQVWGNRRHAIVTETAGTVYKVGLGTGSPIFKDVVFRNDTKYAANTGGVAAPFFVIDDGAGAYLGSVTFDGCIFENQAQAESSTGSNIQLVTGLEGSELIIKNCSIVTGLEADVSTPTTAIKLTIQNDGTWDGSLIIEDMKWLRATSKGEGTHTASAPNFDEYVSSIYFRFTGTWGTGPNNLLHMDMESYAYSVLGGHWGVNDANTVYITNSMFMYGDDDSTQVSLKPNGFGVFGWNNPSGPYPLDDTTYA